MEYVAEVTIKVNANSSRDARNKALIVLKDTEYLNNNLTVRGNTDELLTLKAYITISHYREKIIIALESAGDDGLTPTKIAERSGIIRNHISNVLKELVNKDLIECINPQMRKGRLYRLTNIGFMVCDLL